MVFRSWRIGLDIQCDGARAVALSRGRHGWCLQRWWDFPHLKTVPAGQIVLPEAMAAWHRQLPLGAQLRVSFPGSRTLQKTLSAEPGPLNEAQRVIYLAASMSTPLRMSAAELSLDYCAQSTGEYAVTAARREDVEGMCTALKQLRLTPAAIAPDASALQSFLPFITGRGHSTVIHQSGGYWLWASAQRWGCVDIAQAATAPALCEHIAVQTVQVITFHQAFAGNGVTYVDPWSALMRVQPPLPENGDSFAVALGLALARVRQ
ncbi:hypothetical protein GWD52_03310 [Enterobacteriaceae bacterium 4M9]|nr:hypothetical protein [Enterobacteriaceae bacterium 4M9]